MMESTSAGVVDKHAKAAHKGYVNLRPCIHYEVLEPKQSSLERYFPCVS